jgi:hypothetical protein
VIPSPLAGEGGGEGEWFDKLTMNHSKPFDLPFILSLSKDERLTRDMLVGGPPPP